MWQPNMSHSQSFVVSRFKNRNGATSWRVSGLLAGVRIRRNFPSLEEAAAEKTALEQSALQGTSSGPRAATTFLTADQLRDAEAAFRRLDGHPTLKTCNNRRGILSTLFTFAFQKEWLPTNPVEKTKHHRLNHRRGTAATINAKQAQALMTHVEGFEQGALVPYFALCLFAGIRPSIYDGEISRLQPASVRIETGTIHIEPEVSKVRTKRLVAIQPNLAAWLRAYLIGRTNDRGSYANILNGTFK